MASIPHSGARGASLRAAARSVPLQAAALAAIGVLLVHAETVRSIVAIWWRSETFAHGFIVVPIALWLAWRERRALAQVPAQPFWPALALVALAAVAWVLASVADALAPRQFALVFMVQAAFLAVLGRRLARAAVFPLAFLLFAVPAGEFLLPAMIDLTADFTVAALRSSGVPVYREANHFVIPSGAWSVVEACSGLRYLIASLMIGTLFAAISYRSRTRQLAFIAAAIAVPLVANWVRAYLIVMIGHVSDNRLAVGVDHLIYGWVFFGVVMALLFWVGSWWAEPASQPGGVSPPIIAATPRAGAVAFFAAALAAIVIAAAALGVRLAIEPAHVPVRAALAPVAAPPGFVAAEARPWSWQPGFEGENARLRQSLARDGIPVMLYVMLYANQTKGRELVTSTNQLIRAGNPEWRELERGTINSRFGERDARTGTLLLVSEQHRLNVAWVYWIDGYATANPIVAKAWLAWSRLRGRPDASALVAVATPAIAGPDAARTALSVLAPGVEASLRAAVAQP